jgi:hypothetical protein
MHRLNGGDRRHADARAPGQEFIGGAGVTRRVCGLRMLAAKNSGKRIEACSPASATSAGRMIGPQPLMIACPVTAQSRFSKRAFLARAKGSNPVAGDAEGVAGKWKECATDAAGFMTGSNEQRPNPSIAHVAGREAQNQPVLFPYPNLGALDEGGAIGRGS